MHAMTNKVKLNSWASPSQENDSASEEFNGWVLWVILNISRCIPGRLLTTGFVFSVLLFQALPAKAEIDVPVRSVAQIKLDDDNRPLDYPVNVFFDPDQEEIYLVNGRSNRVVVYGPDFFPRVSIGRGRGVLTPRSGEVTKNGDVYVCQIPTARNPRARVTILNAAFFVDREFFLDEIPEAEDFTISQIAVSSDRLIYLAGNNNRGVLVLDTEGNFLRRLQPMGEVSARLLAVEKKQKAEGEQKDVEKEKAERTEPPSQVEEATDEEKEEDSFADIPEEFRPRRSTDEPSAENGQVRAPVKVNGVVIDEAGRRYLISSEVGKIYVYGSDEKLLFSFGQKGGSPGQMSQPRDLVVDRKREIIYVADYMRHTILVFDLEGKYLFEIGGRGFGPGWFNYPSSVALNSKGHLIVADLFNKRVQVLEVGYEDVFPILNRDLEGSYSASRSKEESPSEELQQVPTSEQMENSMIEEVVIPDSDVQGPLESAESEEPFETNSEEAVPLEEK